MTTKALFAALCLLLNLLPTDISAQYLFPDGPERRHYQICEYFLKIKDYKAALPHARAYLKANLKTCDNDYLAIQTFMANGLWSEADKVIAHSVKGGCFDGGNFERFLEKNEIKVPAGFFEKWSKKAESSRKQRRAAFEKNKNEGKLKEIDDMLALNSVCYSFDYDARVEVGNKGCTFIDSILIFQKLEALCSTGIPKSEEIGFSGYWDLYLILLHMTAYDANFKKAESNKWLDSLLLINAISPHMYATIYDHGTMNARMKWKKDQPSIFGTHPDSCEDVECGFFLEKVINPDELDERRMKIGLPPVKYDADLTKYFTTFPDWYKCKYTIDDYINGKIPTK